MFKKIIKNADIIKKIGIRGWIYVFWDCKKHTEIPGFLARICRIKWRPDQVKLCTYDGSNQCVHPDVIKHKERLYIVYTPYPFTVDVYENPQIAVYDENADKWTPILRSPIVRPQGKDLHYSDPFFFSAEEKLYCFYRLTDKSRNSTSTIYYVVIENGRIGTETRFTDLFDYEYISPFVIEHRGLYFFHIERDTPNRLLVRKFDGFENVIDENFSPREVRMTGFEEDEWIWHLGVSGKSDLNSKSDEAGQFLGVATCIKAGDYSWYYNCFCSLCMIDGEWVLKKEYLLDEKGKKISYSYKSCLCSINGEKRVLETIVDSKAVQGVYYVKLQ